jgi:NADPH2:quinone reductase
MRAGGPEVLELVRLEAPTPGPGAILVRNEAIGVNYIDTYHRSGLYPVPLPCVLGLEAAGVVASVGEGVTRFREGDRVAYASGPLGAYAESHVVLEGRAVALPSDVGFDLAAAVLLKGMTAEFLLRRCYAVQAGEAVLVHAAAGGVGSLLTQWAKRLGARVIGTVGSEAKAELARSQGCDEVILYGEEDVAKRVRALTDGAGVRVAYDGVGAATFEGTLASLGRRGAFVSYGNASGPPPALEIGRLARMGSLSLTRPTLGDYVATDSELDSSAASLFEVLRTGAVRMSIGQTYRLEEARQAHMDLEGRRTIGASLLRP